MSTVETATEIRTFQVDVADEGRCVRNGRRRKPRRRRRRFKGQRSQSALVPLHYPARNGGEPAVEFAIDPAKFHDAFAADLPEKETAVMAATQRPVAESAFSDPAGPPAWKRLPSWAVVATGDKAAGADVIRSMAERAGRRSQRDHT
jgi:hypothetical protein